MQPPTRRAALRFAALLLCCRDAAASSGAAPLPDPHPSHPRAAELIDLLLGGPHFVANASLAPWVGVGYWQEANLDEAFANYLLATPEGKGNSSATARRRTAVAGALQRSFRTYTAQRLIAGTAYGASNTSYDDLLWWALAYLRAHELCVAQPAVLCDAPGGGSLLQQGRLIFDFMYDHSWNEDFCDGGYCWALKAQNYKNCVTNQQGVLVAAKLARLLPAGARCDCKAGETYRAIALRTSGWLRRSPMRNASNGLYNDGLRPEPNSNASCANDNGQCPTLPFPSSLLRGFPASDCCSLCRPLMCCACSSRADVVILPRPAHRL